MIMNLSSKLWTLSKKVVKKSTKHRNSGRIVVQKRPYVKSKVTSFDYNKGAISYGMSFDDIVKDEWDAKDQQDFLNKTIKNLKGYKELIADIEKNYKVAKPQADSWLSRYFQVITHPLDKEISDEELVDKVANFIADLNKGPFTWQSTTWIDGVWLEDERYKITDKLTIRRLKPADLEDERPLDILAMGLPSLESRKTSSAILEFAYRTDKQPELSKELDVTIDCLRLFRVGSLQRVMTSSSSESILSAGRGLISGLPKASHYKYKLSKKDIGKLRKTLETLKPKLINVSKDDRLYPIGIALQRYKEAVSGRGILESRITSVITCLEALFLKPNERTELSSRLSQRVAILLSITNNHSIEMHRNLLLAYEIRSTFIHGSLLSKEEQQKGQALIRKILDYARLSLLMFLVLEDKIEKTKLINKIDNSLLNVESRKVFEDTLKKECGHII